MNDARTTAARIAHRIDCETRDAASLRAEAARTFTGAKRCAERGEIHTATDYLRFAFRDLRHAQARERIAADYRAALAVPS